MKSRITIVLAVLTAACALAGFAGCGGSSKNLTEEEKSTPPLEFGTAAPGTPGAADTGAGPVQNAPKADKDQ